MVDLHHHLLPGLDDGPDTLEDSVSQARAAVQDGITHVVCTPHASGRYPFHPESNAARIAELRSALESAGVHLTLGLGCDFHLSYDNIQDALANPRKYTINQTEYLLVELPDFGIPQGLGESLHELRVAGMTPILTHPERNPTLQKEYQDRRARSRLADWMRQGLLVQVTAGSVMGRFGKLAEHMARRLLDDRWVHVLATDAHDTVKRPPVLSEACRWVTRKHGEHYADLLCNANAVAIYSGEPLPQQDEPRHLFEDDDFDDEAAKPWWKKMFGK